MKTLLVALVLFLSACSGMPDIKVEGVDNLRTTEHKLATQEEVVKVCADRLGYGPLSRVLVSIVACATIVLETWSCDIYYSDWGLKWYPEVLAHERLHCKGYWHDKGLQEYYDQWYSERGIGIYEISQQQ
jgi:hypothetical protein